MVRAAGHRQPTRRRVESRCRHSPAGPNLDRPLYDDHQGAAERGGARARVDPVPRLCAVNLDSVESVSVGVLVGRLGRLSDERMRAVCDALSVAVDCH